MLTILTCTRNRSTAFSLLEGFIARQTLQPDQWIVVNDGTEEYEYHRNQDVVHRLPQEGERHSLCLNLLTGLSWCLGDKIICVEDDDYYHPRFLERVSALLDEVELAGVREAVYYHLHDRSYRRLRNQQHCSLACTGFRRSVVPFLQELAEKGDPMMDTPLWMDWTGSKRTTDNLADRTRPLQVGMKGSKHRGIGLGHQPGGTPDRLFQQLRSWLGNDAEPYVRIANDPASNW